MAKHNNGWVRISLERDAGETQERTWVAGSDPTAIMEGMAQLVEECARTTGLDVIGVLSRLTVILVADVPGGEEA